MRLLEKRLPEERLLGKTDATETRRLEGQNLGHPQARGPSGPIGVANRTIRAAFKTSGTAEQQQHLDNRYRICLKYS